MEFQIEKIWRKQLGLQSVISITANFFDLGGDSLKAGMLINAIRKKLKCQISVPDLLSEPTIAGMATKISTGVNKIEQPMTLSRLDSLLGEISNTKKLKVSYHSL